MSANDLRAAVIAAIHRLEYDHADPSVEQYADAALSALLAEHPAPEPHVVHVTAEPVAEDAVWCDECEEWVSSGAPEGLVPEPPSGGEVTADELARTIWHTSRADESTISATGANHVAAAILARFHITRKDEA